MTVAYSAPYTLKKFFQWLRSNEFKAFRSKFPILEEINSDSIVKGEGEGEEDEGTEFSSAIGGDDGREVSSPRFAEVSESFIAFLKRFDMTEIKA